MHSVHSFLHSMHSLAAQGRRSVGGSKPHSSTTSLRGPSPFPGSQRAEGPLGAVLVGAAAASEGIKLCDQVTGCKLLVSAATASGAKQQDSDPSSRAKHPHTDTHASTHLHSPQHSAFGI